MRARFASRSRVARETLKTFRAVTAPTVGKVVLWVLRVSTKVEGDTYTTGEREEALSPPFEGRQELTDMLLAVIPTGQETRATGPLLNSGDSQTVQVTALTFTILAEGVNSVTPWRALEPPQRGTHAPC